jgi:uncharacterized protein (TIGR03435 family)
MFRTILTTMVVTFLFAGQLSAQTIGQSLSFEVASVRRNTEPGGAAGGSCHGIDSSLRQPGIARTPLGRCVFTRTLGYHLVTYAYGLEDGPLPRNVMIQSVPDWFRREMYDVIARVEDPSAATQEQLTHMLRNLLADRFKLKFHYETKEIAGYDLVPADKGPKFQKSKDGERRSLLVIPDKRSAPGGGKYPATFRQINARRYSLDDFVIFLSGSAGGPVVDKTGLSGDYDIDLSWDVELGPSLFTAIQEQLGLRLVPRKSDVKFLVVDSVERPTNN